MKLILFLTFCLGFCFDSISQTNKTKETQLFEINVKDLLKGDGTKPINITSSATPNKQFKIKLNELKDDTGKVVTVSSIFMYVNNQTTSTDLTENGFDSNTFNIDHLFLIRFEVKFKEVKHVLNLHFIPEATGGDTSIKTPSFLVVSFIKTLAGSEVRDELIDIFLKINYGRRKRTFSMFGVDAGINASNNSNDTTIKRSTSLLRLNEAMVNFNTVLFTQKLYYKNQIIRDINRERIYVYADTGTSKKEAEESLRLYPYSRKDWKKKDRINYREHIRDSASVDKLKRVAYMGAGLKVFYQNPYVGGHFGIMEMNSVLMGSYFMVGYYYAPYIRRVDSTLNANVTNGIPRNYRHNIYMEAGLNAFGDGVPNILKSIRFKFGYMLPLSVKRGDKGDTEKPFGSDALYRLAVEVPIGGVFKF